MIAFGGRPRQLGLTPRGGAEECCQRGGVFRERGRTTTNTINNKKTKQKQPSNTYQHHTTTTTVRTTNTTTQIQPTETTQTQAGPDSPELTSITERFGNSITTKHDRSLRIMFQNVNGLPSKNEGQKNTHILDTVNNFNVDVLALSETNKYWPNIPTDHRPQNRFRGWWENSHVNYSFNSTFRQKQANQPGGNLMITVGRTATRVDGAKSGEDVTKLGRWCFTSVKGKNGKIIRMVTAYRPSNKIAKRNTAYSQHIRHFNQISRAGCPQKLFWEDLFGAIDKWQTSGDSIILTVDANQDVRTPSLQKEMEKRGMSEVFLSAHGEKLPPTCSGSLPIDGIFATGDLRIMKCGYLGFGEGVFSDHRALWADIDTASLYDNNTPLMMNVKARRLTLKNPKVVDKYLALWGAFAIKHKLADRITAMRVTPSTKLNLALQLEYKKIDQLRTEGKKFAEQGCRKVRKGQVPFSPQLKVTSAKVDLYKLAIRWKKGGRVSSRKMERLSKSCKVTGHKTLPLTYSKLGLHQPGKCIVLPNERPQRSDPNSFKNLQRPALQKTTQRLLPKLNQCKFKKRSVSVSGESII